MAAKGEGDVIDGWLAYGSALNEGRNLFPEKENDRAFGEWVRDIMSSKLEDIHPAEQSAAMWAAAKGAYAPNRREKRNKINYLLSRDVTGN